MLAAHANFFQNVNFILRRSPKFIKLAKRLAKHGSPSTLPLRRSSRLVFILNFCTRHVFGGMHGALL